MAMNTPMSVDTPVEPNFTSAGGLSGGGAAFAAGAAAVGAATDAAVAAGARAVGGAAPPAVPPAGGAGAAGGAPQAARSAATSSAGRSAVRPRALETAIGISSDTSPGPDARRAGPRLLWGDAQQCRGVVPVDRLGVRRW